MPERERGISMETLRFNFNNEADILEINRDEEGHITIPSVEGAPVFNSIEEFAEYYAIARNVSTDNLKNWELIKDGDVISYVLRAGTAGVAAYDIEDTLEEVYRELPAHDVHPLDIMRLRRDLDNSDDVAEALAATRVPETARKAYDLLAAKGAFDENIVDEQNETWPEDTRSELEIDLDRTMERVGSLALYAQIVNLPITATKDEILNALENGVIRYTSESLAIIYDEIIRMAKAGGHGIHNERDAILIASQAPVGTVDNEVKARLTLSATIARREGINIETVIVGQHNIKASATYVLLVELADMDVYTVDGRPVIYRFDDTIDAEFDPVEDEDTDDYDEGYDEDEDGYDGY